MSCEEEDEGQLVDVSEVLFNSLSASSKRKYTQALKLVNEQAKIRKRSDPNVVTSTTSQFVTTLLHDYCKMGYDPDAESIKKEDALIGLISGMRWVYELAGHRGPWTVFKGPEGKLSASGNPLKQNAEIDQLKLAHRRVVSELGVMTRHAPSLPAYYIIEHARMFWLASVFDRRDVALHAVFLIAINCGLRYAEIKQMKLDQLTCSRHEISFTINAKTKNSLESKEYFVEAWPGNHFSDIVLMDPFISLSSWLEIRGDTPGFVFCDIDGDPNVGKQRLKHGDPWPAEKFKKFFQTRLIQLGMAPQLAKFYTGHSLKRTCVQLLRTLGVLDVDIMQRVKMEGVRAYLRYTEAFNPNQPKRAPGFSSIEANRCHVENVMSGRQVREDEAQYEFMERWIRSAEGSSSLPDAE